MKPVAKIEESGGEKVGGRLGQEEWGRKGKKDAEVSLSIMIT